MIHLVAAQGTHGHSCLSTNTKKRLREKAQEFLIKLLASYKPELVTVNNSIFCLYLYEFWTFPLLKSNLIRWYEESNKRKTESSMVHLHDLSPNVYSSQAWAMPKEGATISICVLSVSGKKIDFWASVCLLGVHYQETGPKAEAAWSQCLDLQCVCPEQQQQLPRRTTGLPWVFLLSANKSNYSSSLRRISNTCMKHFCFQIVHEMTLHFILPCSWVKLLHAQSKQPSNLSSLYFFVIWRNLLKSLMPHPYQ